MVAHSSNLLPTGDGLGKNNCWQQTPRWTNSNKGEGATSPSPTWAPDKGKSWKILFLHKGQHINYGLLDQIFILIFPPCIITSSSHWNSVLGVI